MSGFSACTFDLAIDTSGDKEIYVSRIFSPGAALIVIVSGFSVILERDGLEIGEINFRNNPS